MSWQMAMRVAAVLLWIVAATGAAHAQTVVQYHADAARTGRYVVPGLTAGKVSAMSPAPALRVGLAGPVYAAPLYATLPDGRTALIVGTEQNVIEALDARNGAVIWHAPLGQPVRTSSLPCGDINPMGITGTPVIDGDVVYTAAMVLGRSGVPQQLVFALDLSDGRIKSGWPVHVAHSLAAQNKRFIAANQGQRSALSVAQGRVFVAYAGHFGDCRYYHGWVVGIEGADPAAVTAFSTAGQGGGIWAPGGMVSDGRSFFVATGNTIGARHWAGGEAVFRLGLDGQFSGRRQDYFTPSNWKELDDADLDLGATNPMLIGSRYVLALGKDGNAYLMNRADLGGLGGQVAEARVSRVPIRTAPASFVSNGDVFVVFQGEGAGCPAGEEGDLVALQIAPGPHISVAWCAPEHGLGAPIVTTAANGADPIVWAIGAEGDERLRAFRASDGKLLFTSQPLGLVRRFETPAVGGGRIYVAADSALYAFAF
ncbi:MAG: PQQ-binding-like beta-propeller repeat protein [Acetobacteraceae bacterium]